MLPVQEYLLTHSFGQLAQEHGVYISFDKAGKKFSLNYDMIETKDDDALAAQCRGLILCFADLHAVDTENGENRKKFDDIIPGETKILAAPLNRFFNFGQGSAAEIDWNTADVLEKADGTLSIVHWDITSNSWQMATRAVPEADLLLDDEFTFRTLFEKALNETNGLSFDEFTSNLDKNITYCFELCTPYNRIVVKYDTCQVILLAMRNLATLKEVALPGNDLFRVPVINTHSLKDIKGVLEWVASCNPVESEGVVVRDQNFNRIKIKNPGYLALNRARDTFAKSPRGVMEIILLGQDDDVAQILPPVIMEKLYKIKSGLQKMIIAHDIAFKQAINDIGGHSEENRKQYASTITVLDNIWTAPLFQMFGRKCSNMKEFIEKSKKDGSFPDSFLDKLIDMSKIYADR